MVPCRLPPFEAILVKSNESCHIQMRHVTQHTSYVTYATIHGTLQALVVRGRIGVTQHTHTRTHTHTHTHTRTHIHTHTHSRQNWCVVTIEAWHTHRIGMRHVAQCSLRHSRQNWCVVTNEARHTLNRNASCRRGIESQHLAVSCHSRQNWCLVTNEA